MKAVILIAFLLCAGIVSANQVIKLEEVSGLKLNANDPQKFDVVIPKEAEENAQLYITAQSPFSDPMEMPRMKINSEDGLYSQMCFDGRS